jgi:hypothetical protein
LVIVIVLVGTAGKWQPLHEGKPEMDSGMVGSTRATLLTIKHDAGVALVGEEVQSPFKGTKQRAGMVLPALHHCSRRIIWRDFVFRTSAICLSGQRPTPKNDAVATVKLIRWSVQEVRRI